MALTHHHHQSNPSASQTSNAFTASVEANPLVATIKGSVSAPATKRGIDALRMICLTVLALTAMTCGTLAYTHRPTAAALTQLAEQKIEPAHTVSTRHSQNSQPRLRRARRTQRRKRRNATITEYYEVLLPK